MKRTLITIGVIIAVAGLAYGSYKGYRYFKGQMDRLMNYCIKVTGGKVNGMPSLNRINFDINLKIKNNSDLSITLSSYRFDIMLNGRKVTTVGSGLSQVLAANDFSPLMVNIDFNPKEVFKGIGLDYLKELVNGFLLDRSKIVIGVKGVVSGKVKGIDAKNIPVEFSMTLANILAPAPDDKEKETC